MLTLNIKTFEKSIDTSKEFCGSFKKPLIFYLKNKQDFHAFFPTFVILDFQKNSLTYIISYLPDNVALAKNQSPEHFFNDTSLIVNPHCAISIKTGESFLVFFEEAPFFFHVNYHQGTLQIHSEEIFKNATSEKLISFSPTNFKDDQNPAFFYFSALLLNKNTQEKKLRFYRSTLDLSNIEEIHSQLSATSKSPHAVRKIKQHLISSDFLARSFKNLKTGEIFKCILDCMHYTYQSLYREYCEKTGTAFSSQLFKAKNHIATTPSTIKLETGFASFCHSKGKDFIEICKRNPEYAFRPLPGLITFLNLETKKEKTLNTTFCAPAHFEINTKTEDIFVSSHNFSFFGETHFFGPAAIDRLSLIDGNLLKISTFSHPTGYRFTSHRFFSWQGKNYLCTFGQPNRLFFIDADTMELEFYEDIGEDFLSNQVDITHYLNYSNLWPFEIINIEVSPDGQFIFFVNHDHLYLYSFPERKIVQKISHNKGMLPKSDISLSDFHCLTVHTNYLA